MQDQWYWYTIADVAALLEVHPESVRRWIRSGKLPATIYSRKNGYYICSTDLNTFCETYKLKYLSSCPDRSVTDDGSITMAVIRVQCKALDELKKKLDKLGYEIIIQKKQDL